MRLSYLFSALLALAWIGFAPSTKDAAPDSPCRSSIFLPSHPLIAVQSSGTALRSSPQSAAAHEELGKAYLALFDSSELAQQEFREAVRLDPSSSAGYAGFGWSYLDLNSAAMTVGLNRHNSDRDVERYRLALDMFMAALRLDPDDASAHLGRAQAFYFLDRNEDAETACRAALASCPNSGETWDLLGDVLVKLRRYNEAVDAYEAEIEISSTGMPSKSLSPVNNRGRFDVFILYGLVGDILFTLHRSEEAIAHYEKALAIGGDSSLLHHRLALAYYQRGEYDRYESHLEVLRSSCSRTGDVAGSCHFYDDVVYRLSKYESNEDMLFRVTNLDSTPTMR
jgi:tetratricopeptide (TPR) repeat protein